MQEQEIDNNNPPLAAWERVQKVAEFSNSIEDKIRDLIVQLCEINETSDIFTYATNALSNLEKLTVHLEETSYKLKPQPSLREIAEALSKSRRIDLDISKIKNYKSE